MKHSDSVFDDITFKGEWWLPESPDISAFGELVGSDAGGYSLNITGRLCSGSIREELCGIGGYYGLIYGVSGGRDLTLVDVVAVGSSVSCSAIDNGHCNFEYRPRLVVQGVHLKSEDLIFKNVYFKYNFLNSWINYKPIELDFDIANFGVSLPDKQQIYCNNYYVVYLKYVSASGWSKEGTAFYVEWEPAICVESIVEEMPWESCSNSCAWIIHSLGQLFSILSYHPMRPFDILAYSSLYSYSFSNNHEQTYMREISLLEKRQTSNLKYDMMARLLPWEAVSDEMPKHIGNWFAFFDGMQGPISLLVDSMSKGESYSPERFFNVMTALEGLHRRCFRESTPDEAHQNKIKSILCSSAPEYRKWLGEKLRYSHEPSLRNRVKELAGKYCDIFCGLICADGTIAQKKDKSNRIINDMVEMRNVIAHGLSEYNAMSMQKCVAFTRIAEVLMCVCLFEQIGIDGNIVENYIKNNSTLNSRISIWSQYLGSK